MTIPFVDPPKLKVDRKFDRGTVLRGHLSQIGTQASAYQYGREIYLPDHKNITLYEQVSQQDTSLQACVNVFLRSLLSSVGTPTHPDPDIANYLDYTVSRMEGNGVSFDSLLYSTLYRLFISGFYIGEPLYELENGSLFPSNLIGFAPGRVYIKVDKNGNLTDGAPTISGSKSGIWVKPGYISLDKRLPMWKSIYLKIGASTQGPRWFGNSAVAPCYAWYKLKEELISQMVTTMDRTGNPLTYISMPIFNTGEKVFDPVTGTEREITNAELFIKAMEDPKNSQNFIVIPQMTGDNKPAIGSLTTGNNHGETFIRVIEWVNEQMSLALDVPYFLVSANAQTVGEAPEHRMHLFYSLLSSWREQVLKPLARQLFHRAVLFNFNRESARVAPYFPRKYSDRPEDLVNTMQMIRGMQEIGAFNPLNAADWSMMREMVGAGERKMTQHDIDYINSVVIEPLQRPTPASGAGSFSKSSAKKPKAPKRLPGGGRKTGQSDVLDRPRN